MQGRDNKRALHLAAQGGHERTVRLLIKRGARLKAPTQEGGLAHSAASGGLVWLLELCKARGISLVERGRRGETPLDLAARLGRTAVIEYLGSQGVACDAPNRHGYTPLHGAAQAGQLGAVKALVKLQADVNAPLPRSRWTALQSAIYNKQAAVARFLLRQQGVKLDAMIVGHGDYHGWRALHLACYKGLTGVAGELIRAGADVNAAVAKPGPQNPPRWRTKRWSDGYRGWTPLHFAASQGQLQLVRLLLKKGASRQAKTHAGQRPHEVARGAVRGLLR
jgi:ankyrin repeat protein